MGIIPPIPIPPIPAIDMPLPVNDKQSVKHELKEGGFLVKAKHFGIRVSVYIHFQVIQVLRDSAAFATTEKQ